MKWPSWWNVVLGVWLIVAPWVLRYGGAVGATHSSVAATEDVVLGIAVIVFGLWASTALVATTAPGWVTLILGIWIVIAPWVLGYAAISAAATNDVIIGIAIIILSAIRVGTARALPRTAQP